MKTNETKQTKIQEKRNYLKGLSKPIQALVKEGAFFTVNEGLKQLYADEGHTELKTVRQWNKAGKRVNKGEKALLLWGTPKKLERMNDETAEIEEMDWWDKEGVSIIPDTADPKMEAAKKAPSWRRICKVLLKNDYWCKGLSFSQTKRELEKQVEIITKYSNLL